MSKGFVALVLALFLSESVRTVKVHHVVTVTMYKSVGIAVIRSAVTVDVSTIAIPVAQTNAQNAMKVASLPSCSALPVVNASVVIVGKLETFPFQTAQVAASLGALIVIAIVIVAMSAFARFVAVVYRLARVVMEVGVGGVLLLNDLIAAVARKRTFVLIVQR